MLRTITDLVMVSLFLPFKNQNNQPADLCSGGLADAAAATGNRGILIVLKLYVFKIV
jgi:hypothetical protein